MDRQTNRHSWGTSSRHEILPGSPLDGRLSPVLDVTNSSGNEDEGVIEEKQEVSASPVIFVAALIALATTGFSAPRQPKCSFQVESSFQSELV